MQADMSASKVGEGTTGTTEPGHWPTHPVRSHHAYPVQVDYHGTPLVQTAFTDQRDGDSRRYRCLRTTPDSGQGHGNGTGERRRGI